MITQSYSTLTAAECHIRNYCPQISVEGQGSSAEMSPSNGESPRYNVDKPRMIWIDNFDMKERSAL